MERAKDKIVSDRHSATKTGVDMISKKQQKKLVDIVDFARSFSPYYNQLYKDLPEQTYNLESLPIVNKKDLMDHFDQWVTDSNVKLKDVEAFINDPAKIGEKYLGKYNIMTTSGTTGKHGIFLKDKHDLSVNFAINARTVKKWLGVGGILRFLFNGGRMAGIVATNGHFLAFSGLEMMRKSQKSLTSKIKTFSVHSSVSDLVCELNVFKPAILLGYGSVISMLADEQQAGRLSIRPVLIQLAGESVNENEYGRIAKIFNSKVHDIYGSTECPYLSSDCREGWYHINSDWVIVEPVNENYQPVEPGQQSHTVLITNLANRIQPIIRYDLGDSIVERKDNCPCGDSRQAIRVRGRASDILTFTGENGEQVSILPLALVTLIDGVPGIKMYQLVQKSPKNLSIRTINDEGVDFNGIREQLIAKVNDYLKQNGLDDIILECVNEMPEQSHGGKYLTVITLKK